MSQTKNNNIVIELLAELMSSGSGRMDMWELLVIYPVANQSLILVRGIRESIESKNYVCAASLLRSLVESAMALVYALTIPKDNEEEFYKSFAEHGRLQRWSKSNKKWENVRDDHLIKQFEEVTKLRMRGIYDKLCNVIHFSSSHTQMLIAVRNGSNALRFSERGPEMSQEAYDALAQVADEMMAVIKRYIAAEIHLKRSTFGDSISELANSIIDIGLVTHAKR